MAKNNEILSHQSGRKDLTAKSHALTSVCTLRFVCSCISTIRREAALASAAPVSTNGMVLAGGYTLDILTV